MQLLMVAATVLRFTVPTQQADTLDGCYPDPSRADRIASVRLSVAYCGGDGHAVFVRAHNVTAGQSDTFSVDNSRCATYFVAVRDSAGNESCPAAITVGIPPTAVPPQQTRTRLPLYDIAGRRVAAPTRAGIWFTKDGRIVVIR